MIFINRALLVPFFLFSVDVLIRRTMADEEDKNEIKDHLNLKVITQEGTEIYFKCKTTTSLSKLMNAFCTRQGVSMQQVRFLFDGNRINDSHTPESV